MLPQSISSSSRWLDLEEASIYVPDRYSADSGCPGCWLESADFGELALPASRADAGFCSQAISDQIMGVPDRIIDEIVDVPDRGCPGSRPDVADRAL